jgi:hypothetical protein
VDIEPGSVLAALSEVDWKTEGIGVEACSIVAADPEPVLILLEGNCETGGIDLEPGPMLLALLEDDCADN